MFHVPGAGSKSTDELSRALAQAVAYKPAYMLSVHSDAVGDAKQTGILMLMAREADRYIGIQLGRAIAVNVGLPFKAAWVYGHEARKINYLSVLRTRELEGCLVEVGEHATVAEAAWNWRHIKEIGVGIANALADYLGLTEEVEDMTDEQWRVLREIKVSTVALSYLDPIMQAVVAGDMATAARLRIERDGAVKEKRRELGL
jgi:hypothetical protein